MSSLYTFSRQDEKVTEEGHKFFSRAKMMFDAEHKTWTCDEEARSAAGSGHGANTTSRHWSSGTYSWTPDHKLRLEIRQHKKHDGDIMQDVQDQKDISQDAGEVIEFSDNALREGIPSVFNRIPMEGDNLFIEEGQGRLPSGGIGL